MTRMPDQSPDMFETTAMPPLSGAPELPARYENLGELGHGGMGIVYKARDRETGEVLAIKTLKPEIASDTQILERFKNELLLAHKITHRNVARLYEFHREGRAVYLSMEFVEGESLRALIERSGRLPVPRIIELASQLASGLGEAHRQSIAHRDLKPENIMLSAEGELKVMDFGISRSCQGNATATGAILGTPAYMAPEQAEGKPVDHRTDIYAFGLILYEMFTGRIPFTGETPLTVALKQIRELPAPPSTIAPDVPMHIERAILKCLEKDPANRFQSVDDLVRALDGEAPHQVPVQQPAPKTRSFRGLAILAGVLVIAAVGFFIWQRRGDPDSITFPLEQFTLANGLKVTLSPDHASPTFSLTVAYRAGFRRDKPGRSGLAHLAEHVMFQGSPNVGRGEFMSLVNGAGGIMNGQTNADLSLFWMTLPANQLELALFLEADRMRALEITPEGLDGARKALLEERAASFGAPYVQARYRIAELAHQNFPNQTNTFGTVADISAATADDVAQFYQTYFAAANAGLVLVGDFDSKTAKARIRHYFESIPARAPTPPADVSEPARTAERRENMTDPRIQAPTVIMAWSTPSATDPDWFAVKRFGEVLGASEAARLQSALVKGAGVAAGAQVNLEDTAGPNLLFVTLVVAPGKDPAQAEKLALLEMDRVAREGVTEDELERLRTDALRRRALLLVTTTQRAAVINMFQTVYQKLEAVNGWEKAESQVTNEDVKRVAQKYFTAANRNVIVVTPAAEAKR